MDHPHPLRPQDHASYESEKMGKTTLFRSDAMMVGLNAFEPGQAHRLHTHTEMDKLYYVLEGSGAFLLVDDREERMEAGMLLVAPRGIPHGIRNDSDGRLLVMVVLAPPPQPRP